MARPETTADVAICTYRRPAELRRLIDSLSRLHPPPAQWSFGIVVVDDDPQASAEPVVGELRKACAVPIRYLHRGAQNISAARNLALSVSDADYLLFLDDDEEASGQWLSEMLAAAEASRCDVLFGPVLPAWPAGQAPSGAAAAAFGRKRRTPGSAATRDDWRSGNVLLDLAAVREAGVRFDEAFGRSGGEDYLFFHQLNTRGARMLWCPTAVVAEHVNPNRTGGGYLLRRSFVNCQTYVRVNIAVSNYREVVRTCLLASAFLVALGLPSLFVPENAASPLFKLKLRAARSLGKLSALFGFRTALYGSGPGGTAAHGAA